MQDVQASDCRYTDFEFGVRCTEVVSPSLDQAIKASGSGTIVFKFRCMLQRKVTCAIRKVPRMCTSRV